MKRRHRFVCFTILTAAGLAANSLLAAETNVISGRTGVVAVRVDERSAGQAEPPVPAPKITMNDLLQRFAEARDRMKSFVIEGRCVTTFNDQDLKWSGVNYTKTEHRYDGKRSKDTEFIWGNVAMITPDVKENQANYRSSLWDGKNEYYYQKADPPRPGSVTITHRDDPRRDRGADEAAQFIKRGAVGQIMGCQYFDDAARNKQSSAYERHYRFTNVVFDPDHEALKSFVPNDIANATPVRFRDLPSSQTFIWQNGRVVDKAGQVRFDSRLK